MRELTVTSRVVESVAYYEMIGYGEANPVSFEWGFASSGLVEQHAGMYGCGLAREDFILYARQGVSGIEDVVDEQNVPAFYFGSKVAQYTRTRLGRSRISVTGYAYAIESEWSAQVADEVCGEYDGPVQ